MKFVLNLLSKLKWCLIARRWRPDGQAKDPGHDHDGDESQFEDSEIEDCQVPVCELPDPPTISSIGAGFVGTNSKC